MLAKTILNSIEILMSRALIDLDISHEKFKTEKTIKLLCLLKPY